MNVRELKDNGGVVFSPKVSSDSVYMSGTTTTLTSEFDSYLPKTGGTVTGDTTFNRYLKINAWSGYGTGSADFWYNGTDSTLYIQNATKLILQDTYVSKEGHTHNYAGSSSAGGAANSLAGFVNTANSGTAIDDAITNGHYYVNGTGNILGMSDGCCYVQAYNSAWVHQIYGDYRTGKLAVRGKNDGTWQSWKTVILSGVTNPDITASGFYVSSSRTVKENIKPTTINGEDMVNSIDVVDFTYKTDEHHNPKIGFIAEDTDPLLSTPEQKRMDFSNCIGVMMKAIQELSAKVKTLTNKLESLTPPTPLP